MITVINGDALTELRKLPDQSIQCCVTSPPYWGLRDYGAEGQLGLEETPEQYVYNMVAVFSEVKRVLRDDGTLWLNLGDSYAAGGVTGLDVQGATSTAGKNVPTGLKPKDLVGIPWRVAFALQADGWYLRSDIIWHKPNPMPESVTDRPTKSHEYIFLLSKSERYYYDAEAIREPAEKTGTLKHLMGGNGKRAGSREGLRGTGWVARKRMQESLTESEVSDNPLFSRNKRTVWTIATQPYAEAHFATFPEDLVKPCILAGSKPGDTVLDPFGGSGTTGKVALELGRSAKLIELNPEYVRLISKRTAVTPAMF